MFENRKFIIIFLIIPVLKAQTSLEFGSNCLIHNEAYKFEYLHASNENAIKKIESAYLKPLVKVNDFNKIRWSLIETKSKRGQYYLKSSFYGDYLCARSSYADIFQSIRKVIRLNVKIPHNDCKWKISKLKSKTSNNTYLVTNVFFNEILYAASYFFPYWIYEKRIYLSNNMNYLKPGKYKWIIDCKKGDYLWI